jgi:pimeloyl-ACP methyl ester carboxylesterase
MEVFKSKVTNLHSLNKLPWLINIGIKSLVNEFSLIIDFALVSPLAYMERFHLFGANPTKLTNEQIKQSPILLLHGNGAHQGTFLPLLQALEESGNKRPVYTLNLPPNCNDTSLIFSKIEEIKKSYNMENGGALFNIDMVGHSMGSGLIQQMSHLKFIPFSVGRVITLGAPYKGSKWIFKNVFDIIGKKDVLCIRRERS